MNETYEYELQKGHPRANVYGYVYKHILVAEKKLGRYLSPEEVVHHIDRNRKNNREENIAIFKSNADHSAFHKGVPCIENNGVFSVDDNYRHKFKKKCTYCGKNFYCITAGQRKYCSVQCFRYASRKVERPPTEMLIEEVNAHSLEYVGRKYGVTGKAIKKWIVSAHQ